MAPLDFKPMGASYGIISPEILLSGYSGERCSKRVLLTFTRRAYEAGAGELTAARRIKMLGLEAVKGLSGSREVCCVRIPAGAAMSTFYLEVLAYLGGRYFIAVGEAGAIHPCLRIGGLLVPTWGLREEGASYHYMPEDYVPRPSTFLLRLIVEELEGDDVEFMSGGVWSTDAVFKESKEKVDRYSRMGVLGVDMESTALMTTATCIGVHLAVVLAVSDELYHPKWVEGFKSCELAEMESVASRLAVKALSQTPE